MLQHPFLANHLGSIEREGTSTEDSPGPQQLDEGGLADLEEVCAGLAESSLPRDLYGVKGIEQSRLQVLAQQLGLPLEMTKERIDQALATSLA